MARRRRSYYRSSRPQRSYEWARRSIAATWGSSNTASGPFDLLGDYQSVLGADAAGTTITRIRGQLSFGFLGAENAGYQPEQAVWGIRVGSEPVSGSLTDQQQHDLLTQHYADWMIYEQPFVWPFSYGSLDPTFTVSPNLVQFYDVDIKSQRRLSELQQSLYFYGGVAKGPDEFPTDATMWCYGYLNILLKRP